MTVHAYTSKSVVGRSDIRVALKKVISFLCASEPLFDTLVTQGTRSDLAAILSLPEGADSTDKALNDRMKCSLIY